MGVAVGDVLVVLLLVGVFVVVLLLVKDARRLVAAQTTLEEELRAIRVLLQTITTFCKHPNPAGSICVDCGAYLRHTD